MSKRRYTVRLYQRHDVDLITFCELYQVSFTRAAYCVLKAFVDGQVFVLAVPPKRIDPSQELSHIYHKKLILDTAKDQKMIDLMEAIAPGYKNSFIKNLLRQYIRMPATELYMDSPEAYEKMRKLEDSLRSGIRVANAGNLSKWTKKNKELQGLSAEEEDKYLFTQLFLEDMPVVKQKKAKKKIEVKEKVQLPPVEEKLVEEKPVTNMDAGNDASDMNADELTDLFSTLMGM